MKQLLTIATIFEENMFAFISWLENISISMLTTVLLVTYTKSFFI